MKKPNLDEIKAYVDKHFTLRNPVSMPDEYYLIDNVPVTKDQFENADYIGSIIHSASSITHIRKMTYDQIMEKFGDQLSDTEKEHLQSLTKKQYSGPGILEQLHEDNANKVVYTRGALTEEQLNKLRL